MNKTTIFNAIANANSALSPKGVAHYANIDATSENLNEIRQAMWAMANAGDLTVFDRREEKNGGLFFAISRAK